MKKMKKMLALMIAVIMCLGMFGMTAFAAETDYQIIIDNAVKGETYTAYKVFDVTYANQESPVPTVTPETNIPGAADTGSAYKAYSYTINDSSNSWWPVVTAVNGTSQVPATVTAGTNFTANGLKFIKTTVDNIWNVEATDDFNAAAFAVLLNNNKDYKTKAAEVTANDQTLSQTTEHTANYTTGKITLNVGNSGAGYYFVDTTTGSLCSLDTTEPTATIREKNSLPTQDKSVSTSANGTYGDSISENIGDTAYFKIEVTDGTGTDTTLIVHDIMSAGLTLNENSFTVQANTGTDGALETVADTNYIVKISGLSDNCTFEIEFKDTYIASLETGKIITIKYTATLNENAVIAKEGNPNTSKVEYSKQFTPEDTVKVYTYSGAIYKVDGTQTSGTADELDGATFAVTDSEGNPVKLTRVKAGSDTAPAIYRYDTTSDNTSIVTPASGAVVVIGFKEDTTLTLTETAAPQGYNPLTAPVTLTIKAQSANTVNKIATTTGGATATFVATTYITEGEEDVPGDDGGYQINADSIKIIENKTGTELPSTGGIGTTIFYIIGGILVVGACVVLVTRRRMSSKK